jgi:hypothetical protein
MLTVDDSSVPFIGARMGHDGIPGDLDNTQEQVRRPIR